MKELESGIYRHNIFIVPEAPKKVPPEERVPVSVPKKEAVPPAKGITVLHCYVLCFSLSGVSLLLFRFEL